MVAQGNALGFGVDRCALQGRRNPPPLQGGRGISDTLPGRCPGLASSAPLARHRGWVVERRNQLRSDLWGSFLSHRREEHGQLTAAKKNLERWHEQNVRGTP